MRKHSSSGEARKGIRPPKRGTPKEEEEVPEGRGRRRGWGAGGGGGGNKPPEGVHDPTDPSPPERSTPEKECEAEEEAAQDKGVLLLLAHWGPMASTGRKTAEARQALFGFASSLPHRHYRHYYYLEGMPGR